VRTESFEVDEKFGKEYAGKYLLRELTWAKRSRIIQKYTKYSPVTGQVVSSDEFTIQAELLWASLKEQPQNKPLSLQGLLDEENGIPVGLGEFLGKKVNGLNSVTSSDLRFLLEQLDEESRTLLFQSFGYAKPSGGLPTSSRSSQPEPSSDS